MKIRRVHELAASKAQAARLARFARNERRRGCGHTSSVRAFLLSLLLLASATPVRAAVRFDVFLGYDGILPEASWFPVSFEVQNDGPSFTGVVEVSPGQFDQG